MLKALVIDDEDWARKVLSRLLKNHFPEITDLQLASGPEEGLVLINSFQPDLLFLDVEMPNMNGFDVLNALENRSFDVIFTTAYNQYAIQAIRFSALDYLLKPIDNGELKAAFNRFLQKRQEGLAKDPLYRNLLNNLKEGNARQFKLAIPSQQGTAFYHPSEIIRCEGERNYTHFYLTGKRHILASKTLKEYEDLLSDQGFVRVHKSHLINLALVNSYTNAGLIVMSDQSEVEVSRRRRNEVWQLLDKPA
ncbi:MAG: response regulator transcription factor [Saprospiraceae bacterium]|nr:response regulator transcription factor [Saprospiraceae bacterium]